MSSRMPCSEVTVSYMFVFFPNESKWYLRVILAMQTFWGLSLPIQTWTYWTHRIPYVLRCCTMTRLCLEHQQFDQAPDSTGGGEQWCPPKQWSNAQRIIAGWHFNEYIVICRGHSRVHTKMYRLRELAHLKCCKACWGRWGWLKPPSNKSHLDTVLNPLRTTGPSKTIWPHMCHGQKCHVDYECGTPNAINYKPPPILPETGWISTIQKCSLMALSFSHWNSLCWQFHVFPLVTLW